MAAGFAMDADSATIIALIESELVRA
jgi:hypothetical protein